MFRLFLSVLLFNISLFAATPKLFKPIGDPVYYEISAVVSLSQMHYYKKDKTLLDSFVTKAKKHKKLGFTYDKKRRASTLSKQEQKIYLDGLRELKKQLQSIYIIVRSDLQVIIKKNYVKTFYRLKRTQLDILRIDPKSAKAISNYERKLNKKKRLAKQKKTQQAKDDKVAHYHFIRSNENLNGKWKGKSSDGTKMLATFTKDDLYLTYKTKKDTIVFKGTYKIKKNDFKFFIEHRKRTKADISHIKKVNFERVYRLLDISEANLKFKYKDETISLKRIPKNK